MSKRKDNQLQERLKKTSNSKISRSLARSSDEDESIVVGSEKSVDYMEEHGEHEKLKNDAVAAVKASCPPSANKENRKLLKLLLAILSVFFVVFLGLYVSKLLVPSIIKQESLQTSSTKKDMVALKKPAFFIGEYCIGKHFAGVELDLHQDASQVESSMGIRPPTNSTHFPHRHFDCGEDAFITYHDEIQKVTLLSVADGVGGWTERGIDSSLFSWSILSKLVGLFKRDMQSLGVNSKFTAGKAARRSLINEEYPRALLDQAYSEILEEFSGQLMGSSTICVAIVDHLSDKFYAVNLGDSGFVIYRPDKEELEKKANFDASKNVSFPSNECLGSIVLRSQEQQHAFNFPYQLSPHLGRTIDADLPMMGMKYEALLKTDDVVFLATDGIFDNLFEADLCQFFDEAIRESKSHRSHGQVQDGAEIDEDIFTLIQKNHQLRLIKLVRSAIDKGQNAAYKSPFAINAERAGRLYLGGGKLDDSTAVLLHYVHALD